MRHIKFDSKHAEDVLMPDGDETLDFCFDLFDLLSALRGGVIVGVKADDEQLEGEGCVHVVADWFGEIHRSQTFWLREEVK